MRRLFCFQLVIGCLILSASSLKLMGQQLGSEASNLNPSFDAAANARPTLGSAGSSGQLRGGGAFSSEPAFVIDGKTIQPKIVHHFQYRLGSFRPTEIANGQSGYAGGGGMLGGGAAGPGMSGMSGGMSGMPGAGGWQSSDGESYGGMSGMNPILIYAVLFDEQSSEDRSRIELFVDPIHPNSQQSPLASNRLPSTNALGSASNGDSNTLVKFSSLAESNKATNEEVKLVTDLICQTIWMKELTKSIYACKGQGDSMPKLEKQMRSLMIDQYESQLARQELEADAIQKRLEKLRSELERRKQAKGRVVEIQVGKLILDAQGLLKEEK